MVKILGSFHLNPGVLVRNVEQSKLLRLACPLQLSGLSLDPLEAAYVFTCTVSGCRRKKQEEKVDASQLY